MIFSDGKVTDPIRSIMIHWKPLTKWNNHTIHGSRRHNASVNKALTLHDVIWLELLVNACKMVGYAGTNNYVELLSLNVNLIQTVQVTPEKYSKTALHIRFITLN